MRVVLADPVGSIFSHYYKTGELVENAPFLVEGVGKDSIPGVWDLFLFGVTIISHLTLASSRPDDIEWHIWGRSMVSSLSN